MKSVEDFNKALPPNNVQQLIGAFEQLFLMIERGRREESSIELHLVKAKRRQGEQPL